MDSTGVNNATKKVASYAIFGIIALNAINSLNRFRGVDDIDKNRIIFNRIKENILLKGENNVN